MSTSFPAPFVISQQTDSGRMKFNPGCYADAGKLDAIEQLVALAQEAGLSLTHLAMAFAIAHPGVTSANLGPRTMEQLDDLLADAEVALSDEILDRIDATVAPGTDVGPLHAPYPPPALAQAGPRRRPMVERSAA